MPWTCDKVSTTATTMSIRRGISHIHQAETRRRRLRIQARPRQERSRGAPRVDKELVHILESIEAVGAAPAQDVDVQPVGLGKQQVGLVGDEGEALEEADADAAVGDDLRQGERRGFDIGAALDDLEVRRQGAQILVGVLVGEVAETQGLADLARRKQLLELYDPSQAKQSAKPAR